MPWAKNTREIDNEVDFVEEADLSAIEASLANAPTPKSSYAKASTAVATKDLASIIQQAIPNFNERVTNSIDALDRHGIDDDKIAREMAALLDDPDAPYITKYKTIELAVRMRGGMMRKEGAESKLGGIHIHVGGGTNIADILMPHSLRANPQTILVAPIEEDEKEQVA